MSKPRAYAYVSYLLELTTDSPNSFYLTIRDNKALALGKYLTAIDSDWISSINVKSNSRKSVTVKVLIP